MVPSADAPSAHICEVLTIYYKVRENVLKNQGVINSVKVRKCRNVQSSFFSQNPYLKTTQCWHHCVADFLDFVKESQIAMYFNNVLYCCTC